MGNVEDAGAVYMPPYVAKMLLTHSNPPVSEQGAARQWPTPELAAPDTRGFGSRDDDTAAAEGERVTT